MSIEFLLVAEPNFEKVLCVRECYRLRSENTRIDVNGKTVPLFDLEGHVDDDVISQNKEDYAKFKSFVEEHAEELYPKVKENPGVLYPVYPFAEVKKAIEEESSELEELQKLKNLFNERDV